MKAVVVKDLYYSYGEVQALKGVSLEVDIGEKLAILGPNGSGKTTLLLCIAGLIEPEKGIVEVMGERENFRKHVGIVFQNPDDQVFMPTVFDDIAFGLRNMGLSEDEVKARVENVLRLLNIEHLASRNPANLSGGEKKKVAIAGVLAMKPSIILIDEPTAGLDHSGIHEVFNILTELNAEGITVIVTTHDAEFAFAWADRIITMNSGRIGKAKVKLPGKVSVLSSLEKLGLIENTVFEHLSRMGIKGKVKIVNGKADYCYGIVDFSKIDSPEFDLDIIALNTYLKEVRVSVSKQMLKKFLEEMEKRNVSLDI